MLMWMICLYLISEYLVTCYSINPKHLILLNCINLRCNRLVLHMKLPDSMVHQGKVKDAIIRTRKSSPCGNTCPPQRSSSVRRITPTA